MMSPRGLLAASVITGGFWLYGIRVSKPAAVIYFSYLALFFDGSEFSPKSRYSAWAHKLIASLAWRLFVKQPTSVVFEDEDEIKPDGQYMFAAHPHGVLSACHAVLYTAPNFLKRAPGERRRSLGARPLFLIPFVRDLLLAFGSVDAGKKTASACLKAGLSVTVVPGGEHEQLEARPGEDEVFLKRRKGFCRLACEQGVPVVPCFAFGEVDLMHTSKAFIGIRRLIASKLYVALPIAWGDRWWALWLPRRDVSLTVVIGRPLAPPAVTEGESRESAAAKADEFHARYITELKALYERNKAKYGDATRELRVT